MSLLSTLIRETLPSFHRRGVEEGGGGIGR